MLVIIIKKQKKGGFAGDFSTTMFNSHEPINSNNRDYFNG